MASISDDEMEYLSPSFDPSSLKVPQLRNVLVAHDIPFPSSAKKSQLIEIFTRELVPRSRKILAARSRTRRTSRGITDMPSSQEGTVNGDDEDNSLMPPPPVPSTTRRRSTRSPRVSMEADGDETAQKRTSLGDRKSSTKHARASDTETGTDPEAKRSVVRKARKSDVAPSIRVEEPEEPATRPSLGESAFSHDNPFQSGSSPMGPLENRRKSAGTSTDRRKSSSRRGKTELLHDTGSAPIKKEDGVVVPSKKTFDVPLKKVRESKIKLEDEEQAGFGEEFTPEEQLELVRERAANGDMDILPPRRKKRSPRSSGVSKSAPWVIIMTLLTGYAAWWRREKIEIGYCGLGKSSTSLTNARTPEWASFLQPECEPCPQHAYCYSDMEVRCEKDFVLKSHPLSVGGLVPLPPTCEPDGEKVRKVKAVTDKAVEELRERRAKWECGTLLDDTGNIATKLEIDERELKKEVGQKRRKGMSAAEFEDLWKGALGEMTGRDEVTSEIDGNTHSHLLTSTSFARLPLSCSLRRSVRLALARYRVELAGLIFITSCIAYIRNMILTLRDDAARVPLLVSSTLDRLATQATLYTQGSSPEAWISVGQMRDDVLRDVFSAKRREEIWKKVTAVVEMNANVRPGTREGRSGDVSRVWEWIGSVGALEDAWGNGKRESGRYSYGPGGGGGDVIGTTEKVQGRGEMVEQRSWDEGRPIY